MNQWNPAHYYQKKSLNLYFINFPDREKRAIKMGKSHNIRVEWKFSVYVMLNFFEN